MAAEVLRMRGLWYWYHIGCLSQLWYFPQLQAHVEHVCHAATQLVCEHLGTLELMPSGPAVFRTLIFEAVKEEGKSQNEV